MLCFTASRNSLAFPTTSASSGLDSIAATCCIKSARYESACANRSSNRCSGSSTPTFASEKTCGKYASGRNLVCFRIVSSKARTYINHTTIFLSYTYSHNYNYNLSHSFQQNLPKFLSPQHLLPADETPKGTIVRL